MPAKPSLVTRVAVGKLAGLAFGVIAFLLFPYFAPDAPETLRWGVLLWYLTLGALIGVVGVVTWHPVLRIPLPWWLIGPGLGAWMNLVLALMIHDRAAAILAATFGPDSFLANPLWLMAEGAVIGLVIAALAHLAGGEGREAMDM